MELQVLSETKDKTSVEFFYHCPRCRRKLVVEVLEIEKGDGVIRVTKTVFTRSAR